MIHGWHIFPYVVARLSRGMWNIPKLVEEMESNIDRILKLLKFMVDRKELPPFEHVWMRRTIASFVPEDYRILSRHRYVLESNGFFFMNGRTAIEMILFGTERMQEIAWNWLKKDLPIYLELITDVDLEDIKKKWRDEIEGEITDFDMRFSPLKHSTLLGFINQSPRDDYYSFLIKCSRVCSHQLVRHRVISWIQKSDRVTLPTVTWERQYWMQKYPKHIRRRIREIVDRTFDEYNKLLELGVAREDARYIVPQISDTYLWGTARYDDWMSFISKRRTPEAQQEIRVVASEIEKVIWNE